MKERVERKKEIRNKVLLKARRLGGKKVQRRDFRNRGFADDRSQILDVRVETIQQFRESGELGEKQEDTQSIREKKRTRR